MSDVTIQLYYLSSEVTSHHPAVESRYENKGYFANSQVKCKMFVMMRKYYDETFSPIYHNLVKTHLPEWKQISKRKIFLFILNLHSAFFTFVIFLSSTTLLHLGLLSFLPNFQTLERGELMLQLFHVDLLLCSLRSN